ncbi:MAG: phosphotransferase [Paenibacillus sp.]|uniref:phosphotransferase n=1 Tax=Paenibacillus sp. TaxID=58172 RepID=UPI0025D6593C|nr:phosphotransferase [Paenibacillus sp.]MBR2566951.1 phosphotransferase [Paenibacillus sp.]
MIVTLEDIASGLHSGNLIFHENTPCPIDFGRCGYGHILYDMAGPLVEPTPIQRKMVIDGYEIVDRLEGEYVRRLECFFIKFMIENATTLLILMKSLFCRRMYTTLKNSGGGNSMENMISHQILCYMKQLNTMEVLPESGLRRNSIYYNLITSINHTIALLISGSYDEVALFINRAYREIDEIHFLETTYIELCREYLRALTEYLEDNKLLSSNGQNLLKMKK